MDAVRECNDSGEEITADHIRSTLKGARVNFDIGRYQIALQRLNCVFPFFSGQLEKERSILWGKIISEYIVEMFDACQQTFPTLKIFIDEKTIDSSR